MTTDLSTTFRELEENDFRVLNAVERGMQHNEWVPSDEIPGLARLPGDEVEYRLDRLNDRALIERKTLQYVGFRLQSGGYDQLALNALVKRGSITEMGSKVEGGKESEVYKCRSEDSSHVLKLHREGYTDFREVDRERAYSSDKNHVSWLYTARKAAEKEYEVLEEINDDVSVPFPDDHSRHGVLMRLFDGVELSRADVDEPSVVLDAVLSEIAAAWDSGYVHADMSEYNVLVSETEVVLIDWPQSVTTDHPHSRELLERDISNILSYFDRKYPKKENEFRGFEEAVESVVN